MTFMTSGPRLLFCVSLADQRHARSFPYAQLALMGVSKTVPHQETAGGFSERLSVSLPNGQGERM